MDISPKDIFLFLLPYLLQGIFYLMIPAIGAYLGYKEKTRISTAIMTFMVLFACGLIIYRYLPFDFPVGSTKIEKTLKQWADQGGFSVKNTPQSYARFQFQTVDSQGRAVDVFNLKSKNTKEIVLGSRIRLSEQQYNKLRQKGDKPQRELLDYLTTELIKLGVEYEIKVDSTITITITYHFYYDPLMSDIEFYNNMALVKRAIVLTQILFKKELD